MMNERVARIGPPVGAAGASGLTLGEGPPPGACVPEMMSERVP